MKFHKFDGIKNSIPKEVARLVRIFRKDGIVLDNQTWIVTEKIHGTNLGVYYLPSEGFKIASRNGFTGTGFFGSHEVIIRIKEQVKKLWGNICEPEIPLVLHGELYGGFFDGVSKNRRVQKGVQYRSDHGFAIFDVRIGDELQTWSEMIPRLEEVGLEYQRILFTGTLKQCLEFPEEFDSLKPKELGLGTDEQNLAEGIVLKTDKPMFAKDRRAILKKKNKTFSERACKKEATIKSQNEIPGSVLREFQTVAEFVTLNRLRNVVSHVGFDSMKDFGKVLKEFVEDVISDYLDEEEREIWDGRMRKMLTRECALLMKDSIEKDLI